MPHVEQGLLTLPEDLSSPSLLSGIYVTLSLDFCVVFCRSFFVLLAIVLSVLRFTASGYQFVGIKYWISNIRIIWNQKCKGLCHSPNMRHSLMPRIKVSCVLHIMCMSLSEELFLAAKGKPSHSSVLKRNSLTNLKLYEVHLHPCQTTCHVTLTALK